ncbi:glycosyltransferase family 4 protein [soil metagenome]
MRVLMLSTYPPRVCGIATFAHDVRTALLDAEGIDRVDVIAVQQQQETLDHPPEVVMTIPAHDAGSFREAAKFCNDADYDVVVVQHEFGIFGGPAGRNVLEFVDRVDVPVVTTTHTVLGDPPADLRGALHDLGAASARVVALAPAAMPLLQTAHEVDPTKVRVIHHGVPDVPFDDPDAYNAAVGLEGHPVLLTFGLLSRNKGIEQVLDALPKVVATSPDLRYVVLGATHPEIRRTEGESYRQRLLARVKQLGIEENVEFRDRYVDDKDLIAHLMACDVYVTPYQSLEQITSGTLAYAVGMGRAVVSTPYRHAADLLADDRGLLVPIGDIEATAEALIKLLTNDELRQTVRRRAYDYGRNMTWAAVGEHMAALLSDAVDEARGTRPSDIGGKIHQEALAGASDPQSCRDMLNLGHLQVMTDDVGVLQHATHGVPDRRFGYTTDDQSRALIAMVRHHQMTGDTVSRQLALTYLAYLQFAQLPDGRFRNTMDYGRQWLDQEGTEDTLGQSVWALGVAMAAAPTTGMSKVAEELLVDALPQTARLRHPRSIAYALCGLSEVPQTGDVATTAYQLAERLLDAFARERRPGWEWCDQTLSYANSKIPEALMRAGRAFQQEAWFELGLQSLDCVLQATHNGTMFDFVGNQGWRTRHGSASVYAQQPIEAGYTAEVCAYAAAATGEQRYHDLAVESVAWLRGHNRLGIPLYDPTTGICVDGVERTGVSENTGAESVVCALIGLLAVAQPNQA